MVNNCCVRGCHNRSDRETDRHFYSIPKVSINKGRENEELTSRQRKEWLNQLRLENVHFDSKTRRTVCSDHFVNGTRAYIRDINSPSWKPTLKLGHDIVDRKCVRQNKRQRIGPPVLEDGCLWPTIDHTFCLRSLANSLEKQNAEKGAGKRRKSNSGKRTVAQHATAEQGGHMSKRKAKPILEKSKNGAKTSRVINSRKRKQVCCAEGCQSGYRKCNKFFFVFPVHQARCSEWLQNLGRDDLLDKSPRNLRAEHYRVCSDHFDPDHFIHVGQRVQLPRRAVPTLKKLQKRQPRKSKAAAERRRQALPRLKKNKRQGQVKEGEGSRLLQFKVEFDRAEDPLPHHNSQYLRPQGSIKEQMMLANGAHSELDTWSELEILNSIKLEPLEEGEEMEHIKSEPPELQEKEERKVCRFDHESLMDSTWHRAKVSGEPETGGTQERSLPQRCVRYIKTEPHSPQQADSLRQANGSEESQCEHFDDECRAASHKMNSREGVENGEQVGGGTLASKVIEENDLDMSYTVVKVEPESSDSEQS